MTPEEKTAARRKRQAANARRYREKHPARARKSRQTCDQARRKAEPPAPKPAPPVQARKPKEDTGPKPSQTGHAMRLRERFIAWREAQK